MNKREFSFKINNPLKPDEVLNQQVILSNSLQYDYSKSEWISIDAEFLGLNLFRDKLCSVQIASVDPKDSSRQRVEIVEIYDKKPDAKLVSLMESKMLKIFHVFSSDIAMISRYLKVNVEGPFFDTKIAAKIAWTNSHTASKTELIKSFIDPKYDLQEMSNSLWELEVEKWTPKMIQYASIDVLYLRPIMKKLQQIAENRGRTSLIESAMKAVPFIAELYKAGYDTDVFKF